MTRTQFNTRFYKLKRIPENFLCSELTRRALLDIIQQIELCREAQNSVDMLYEDFCNKLIKEMNEKIPSFDCSKQTRKRYKQLNRTGMKIWKTCGKMFVEQKRLF